MSFVTFSQSDSLKTLVEIEVIEDSLIENNEEQIINTQRVEIITWVDIPPEFPGGPIAMKDFIDSSFVYPKDEVPNIKGSVYVDFYIDTLGQLDSFKVVRGLTPLIDEEALRVATSFPNFTPYIFGAKKQTTHYIVPIKVNTDNKEGQNLKNASYFGGEPEMEQFIDTNLNLTQLKLPNNENIIIYVKFYIDKYGFITNVEIIRGYNEELDEEVVRIIKKMPKWLPAQMNGEPCPSTHELRIKIE